jgi:hypothetical protein
MRELLPDELDIYGIKPCQAENYRILGATLLRICSCCGEFKIATQLKLHRNIIGGVEISRKYYCSDCLLENGE